jgi:hypothetical protein
MDIAEKAAYIKGLAEGLGVDATTKEGKVILAMLELLDDMVDSIADVEDGMDLLTEQLEIVGEELEELQEDVYGEDDYDADFDGELYEVTCPSCNETLCIDESMLDEGELPCPNCGEMLEFDLDGALEDMDCGCGHEH